VLPILWGDRMVGRIEPRIERTEDAVRILNVYWEAGFDPGHPGFAPALAEALDAHRRFAGVGRVLLARTPNVSRLRPLLGEHLAALGRPARRNAVAWTRGRAPRSATSVAPGGPRTAVVGR